MAGRFRIQCINKPDRNSPVEHITHVGGYGSSQWKLTVEDVIQRIESGAESFYVHVGLYETDVEVVSPPGRRKYIKTQPDSSKRDNLLSLPECP
jgi:thioredoxin reductase